MTKLTFFVLFSVFALPTMTWAVDRPNIIILFADDISARELPIYGASVWSQPTKGDTDDPRYRARTPVLDRLANEGCWIRTAWASVVCSPSRAMMMTGRYAHLHKWWGNKSKGKYLDQDGRETTWPLYLSSPHQIGHIAQQAGYGTYWAGKTQMAGDLRRYGFAQGCFTPGNLSDKDNPFTDFKLYYARENGKKVLRNADTDSVVDTYLQHSWYWYPHVRLMNHNGKDFQWWPNTPESKAKFGPGTYGPDVELDFVFDFMEKQVNTGKPFFVYHTSHLGHDAFNWLDPDSESRWPGTPVVKWDGKKYTRTEPRITGDKGQYDTHGTVTGPGIHNHINYLDYQVWLYQNKLKELGVAGNTIFVFCADNGTSGYGKNSTDRQKGVHVPLIISAPGLTKRGEQNVLVNLSDFLPTIADLIGADLPTDYEINGESLVPFLFGDRKTHREWIYGYKDKEQIIRGMGVLRDGRGKWWDVQRNPADLISFPQITDWNSVSPAHRAERDRLLAVLPRFDQRSHGRNAPGMENRANAGGHADPGEPAKPPKGTKLPNASAKPVKTKWITTWRDEFDDEKSLKNRYVIPDGYTGAWSIEAGHLVGRQVSNKHGSVIRAELEFGDVDIQFDFRFRGGTRFNFVIDDKHEKSVHAGHICRASISPNQIMIGDDKEGAMNLEIRRQRQATDLSDEQTKALEAILARTRAAAAVRIQPDKWHTLRLRIRGDVMKAFLDDALVTSLRSPGFAHPTKNKCGFTVIGKSIDFDNLVIRQPESRAANDKLGAEPEKPAAPSPKRRVLTENTPRLKPNILWVVTDDQRADSIAAFNRILRNDPRSRLGQVMSPNIDRLARMGTTFINTFNQNPGCAPSRTLMHTGRYSHRTGVYGFEYYNPIGQAHWRPMVPEILRDQAGYQTVAVGKLGIRAQHFANQKGGTEPPLYQTNLGYRKEFSAKGKVDWNKETKWVNGKPGPKRETFIFPDGKLLVWPDSAESTPNDRKEIQQRLGLLRHYMPNDKDKQSGSILAGLNPQPAEKTRDGNFTTALLDHLAHAGGNYVDLLDRQQRGPEPGKPLFAYVGFEFPHTPVLPPAEFRNRFLQLKYRIPEFTREELAALPPQLKRLFKNSQSDHFTDAEKHQMIADYFAYCAYGDSLVGKAVDGFIQFSRKQNRPWLILYVCGDHGWRLNEHGMVSKFSHYDTDLHNPIIVVASDKTKFPAGKVVRDLTEFVDIAPTFLAAAGIDISSPAFQYLDGRDLASTASGKIRSRDYIIAEPTWVTGPRAVIRTRDYKFAMKIRPRDTPGINEKNAGKDFQWAISAPLKDIEPTLFDLRTDPDEIQNVAFDARYRPILDALRRKLQDIVLGDGRIEIAWEKKPTKHPAHRSNFAPGSDDGIISLPDISKRTRK